jgi:hypothetical protein
MNPFKMKHYAAGRLVWLALAVFLMRPAGAAAEETFPVLQIGTQTYTNVTVTTKAKSYIFIIHSRGMNNIRIADLPADVRDSLGYGVADKFKAGTNSPAAWAKAEVAKLETPQVKEVRKRLAQSFHLNKGAGPPGIALLGNTLILTVLGVLLLAYLFHCYCCMLICRKTGNPPGVLVWLPALQLLPLLRAAGMSRWWFLGFFVPLVNLVAQVLWSLNIAKARGKSVWVGVLLLLPITSLFAFLYLAFSDGVAARDDDKEPEIMSLQTA